VRDLILGLRAKGTTVFFSSHILSDAETLCSRVAIMAQGRLAATGRISEMVAFQLKGWELVVSGVTDELQAALAPKVAAIRALSQGRYTLRIAPDQKPERLMADLSAAGASVESLQPVRDTLEDYFVQQVTAAKARDTGGL
jgi:ABC-2 type transport system ATP-binding protein